MNSGTIAGRGPDGSIARRRSTAAVIATIGASMSTRVSFTTTATASAAGPASCAVATTWPTSCTPAPTQWPNPVAERPSGCHSAGSTAIASVPHSVTSAIGTACSSSFARTVAAIAPIAEAPQIENPLATSTRLVAGQAQRPAEADRADEGDHDHRDGRERS